jgi:hypothetical protein
LSVGAFSVALGPAITAAATAAPVEGAAPKTPAMLGPGSMCGLVKGAPYNYRAASGAKLAGNQYNVTAAAISCASARSYAVALSYADPKTFIDTYQLSLLYNSSGKILAHWPHGFVCAGASYRLTRHKPPTISGYCWKGDGFDPFSSKTTALFDWVARPPSG